MLNKLINTLSSSNKEIKKSKTLESELVSTPMKLINSRLESENTALLKQRWDLMFNKLNNWLFSFNKEIKKFKDSDNKLALWPSIFLTYNNLPKNLEDIRNFLQSESEKLKNLEEELQNTNLKLLLSNNSGSKFLNTKNKSEI